MSIISIAARLVTVDVAGDEARVFGVRRAKRSDKALLMQACPAGASQDAQQLVFAMVAARWGLAEGSTLEDGAGGSVRLTHKVDVRYRLLGPIASEEYFDALTDKEFAAIAEAVVADLPETVTKK